MCKAVPALVQLKDWNLNKNSYLAVTNLRWSGHSKSGFECIVGVFFGLFQLLQVLERDGGLIAWDHEFLFPEIFIEKFSTGRNKNQ